VICLPPPLGGWGRRRGASGTGGRRGRRSWPARRSRSGHRAACPVPAAAPPATAAYAVAIGAQIVRLDAVAVSAHFLWRLADEFVYVVAEKHDQVGVFLGQMAVGGEIAEFVIGAGAEAETQSVERRTAGRCGAGAADRTRLTADDEAVPIVAPRFELGALDMHSMGIFRHGGSLAVPDDLRQAVVERHFPADCHRLRRHATGAIGVGRQRFRRQPGPQNHAVGSRIAGSDAKRERVAGKRARPSDARRRDGRGRTCQERATRDGRRAIIAPV
jgi:hypothetical protein